MKRKREAEFIDDAEDEVSALLNDDAFTPPSSPDTGDSDGSGSDHDSVGGSSSQSSVSEEEEEPPDPSLIQAGPRIVIKAASGIARIEYLTDGDPDYTPADRAGAGGKKSVAILGPGAVRSTNSDADRTVIPAIFTAEAAYTGQHTFKAGHLLNAEFGGSGSDPDNLTILTTSANSAMRTFDNGIKNAITTSLTTAYTCVNDMGIDVSDLGYGIKLTITTNSTFWSNTATDAGYVIPTGVTCVAAIVGEPDLTDLENKLTAQYGAARVNDHVALRGQLTTAISTLKNQVATANAAGAVSNT